VNTYALLKLVHVVSVIAWLGGALTISLLTWRVARAVDRVALASLMKHAAFIGPTIFGSASGLTLLTGIGMVVSGRLDHSALWIQWGFAGIVAHFLFGPLLLRRAGIRLGEALAAEDDLRLAAARRRLGRLNAVYLALLFSVVGAMVLRPTL
jgi:hypothetical protein